MNLTPEQQELGRRNFLKALAGTPALAMLAASAATRGPVRGGPMPTPDYDPSRWGVTRAPGRSSGAARIS